MLLRLGACLLLLQVLPAMCLPSGEPGSALVSRGFVEDNGLKVIASDGRKSVEIIGDMGDRTVKLVSPTVAVSGKNFDLEATHLGAGGSAAFFGINGYVCLSRFAPTSRDSSLAAVFKHMEDFIRDHTSRKDVNHVVLNLPDYRPLPEDERKKATREMSNTLIRKLQEVGEKNRVNIQASIHLHDMAPEYGFTALWGKSWATDGLMKETTNSPFNTQYWFVKEP